MGGVPATRISGFKTLTRGGHDTFGRLFGEVSTGNIFGPSA